MEPSDELIATVLAAWDVCPYDATKEELIATGLQAAFDAHLIVDADANDEETVFVVQMLDGSTAPPDYTVATTLPEAREYANDSFVTEAVIYRAQPIERR